MGRKVWKNGQWADVGGGASSMQAITPEEYVALSPPDPKVLYLIASGINSPIATVKVNDLKVAKIAEGDRELWALPPLVATGGTVTTTVTHRIHTFLSSGTFDVTGGGDVEYLIIAGGGGGGVNGGGGGGAGGLLAGTISVTEQAYSIVIGNGGSGGVYPGTPRYGSNGQNTTALGLTATGGGGGCTYNTVGGSGGSGGGSYNSTGGSGVAGQGYSGGNGNGTGYGGGGGGAGGTGSSNNGGLGFTSPISGSATTYASGGAGQSGTAQPGGGGQATAGAPNTGGGGGGMAAPDNGKAGGSGIVIIRYLI